MIVPTQNQKFTLESPWGTMSIASCRSGNYLAASVAAEFRQTLRHGGYGGDLPFAESVDFEFSDSESCVRLEIEVAGHDCFLFQSLFDPSSSRSINDNYMGFLLAARALREAGAGRVTGVLPYLAYARQDKPTFTTREPISAKLMADLSIAAGIERLITLQPHAAHIQGFYGTTPLAIVDMVPLFVERYRHLQHRDDVIVVAPDAGATKWVQHFCQILDLPVALAAKFRPRPEEAAFSAILGDFTGKRVALILDDIISSGGTIYELARKLTVEKGVKEIYLGAAHNLCSKNANLRLSELRAEGYLQELFVTNSIPQTAGFCAQPFVNIYDLTDTLCQAIVRIHQGGQ